MTISGCGYSGSPSSPSTLTPLTAAPGGSATFRPLDDPEMPMPNPPPGQMTRIINIIGSFGSGAFDVNPIQATVGDMIVWMNADKTTHHIVFDDGTDAGNIIPGQSSAPIAMTNAVVTYHCTIHPSMMGVIGGDLSALPMPPPDYYTPPPDDYYGYY